jgi:hypothetical protein
MKKKINSQFKVFENRMVVYLSVKEKVKKGLEKITQKCQLKEIKFVLILQELDTYG